MGWDVLQTSDGGYIISGDTYSYGTMARGIPLNLMSSHQVEAIRVTWLIKTDSMGNKEWDRILPGFSGDKIRHTSDGGYILGGGVYSSLIKTDSMGNIEWIKFSNSQHIRDVQQTSDEGYIILIGKYDASITSALLKTDIMGNEQWRKEYPNYPNAEWSSILQANDGGYILAGRNNGYATLLKTDANGNL